MDKKNTPSEYIASLPEERKKVIQKLRETIITHLPKGFTETISYGMIAYVVSHSIYPSGYYCNPKEPLPFMSIASQKNHIAIYHMGLYADSQLMQWVKQEYAKLSKSRPDIGKSCIRFKKETDIPFELIAALCSKVTVNEWINRYETLFLKNK